MLLLFGSLTIRMLTETPLLWLSDEPEKSQSVKMPEWSNRYSSNALVLWEGDVYGLRLHWMRLFMVFFRFPTTISGYDLYKLLDLPSTSIISALPSTLFSNKLWLCNKINYLLTYSMEHSPSWEANQSLQLVKKFPAFLWNPGVIYRTHKCKINYKNIKMFSCGFHRFGQE
jgi:hypothetical protein